MKSYKTAKKDHEQAGASDGKRGGGVVRSLGPLWSLNDFNFTLLVGQNWALFFGRINVVILIFFSQVSQTTAPLVIDAILW